MSTVACPYCGGSIEFPAPQCCHCGKNITWIQPNHCLIGYTDYDLSEVAQLLQEFQQGINVCDNNSKAYRIIASKTGMNSEESLLFWKYIKDIGAIPPTYEIAPKPKKTISTTTISNAHIPRCPTCGSTDLIKKNATARAMDGFVYGRLSVKGRAQWKCKKCGHLW